MRTALFLEDGVCQIVLTPENDELSLHRLKFYLSLSSPYLNLGQWFCSPTYRPARF